MRVYFDSCIVIYLIERREPWHSGIRQQLRRLATPDSAVVFTDLNRLECRVFPIAAGMPDLLADYDAFFASDGLSGMVCRPKPSTSPLTCGPGTA